MKELTYKRKLLLVIALGIPVLMLVGNKTIIPLIDQYNTMQKAEHGINDIKSLMEQKKQLAFELAMYKTLIGRGDPSIESAQKHLLALISTKCIDLDCRLVEFPGAEHASLSGDLITTNSLELQGDFPSLLRLTHALETELEGARLVSVSYYKKMDRRNKRERMFSKIIIQHVSEQA